MKCVGFLGFFLDLSSYDMSENKNIGMSFLELDRSYKAVDFSNIFKPENASNKQVRNVYYEGCKNLLSYSEYSDFKSFR